MENYASTIIYCALFILFLIYIIKSFKFSKRKKKELLPKGSMVYIKTEKIRDGFGSLPFEVIKEGVILSMTEDGYIVKLGNLNYLVDFKDVYLKD